MKFEVYLKMLGKINLKKAKVKLKITEQLQLFRQLQNIGIQSKQVVTAYEAQLKEAQLRREYFNSLKKLGDSIGALASTVNMIASKPSIQVNMVHIQQYGLVNQAGIFFNP